MESGLLSSVTLWLVGADGASSREWALCQSWTIQDDQEQKIRTPGRTRSSSLCVPSAESLANKYLLMNQGAQGSITKPASTVHEMKAGVGKWHRIDSPRHRFSQCTECKKLENEAKRPCLERSLTLYSVWRKAFPILQPIWARGLRGCCNAAIPCITELIPNMA